MDIPILGIVENMSYVKCDCCGKEIKVFGESHVEEVGAQYGIPVLGKIPMDPSLAQLCDQGNIETVQNEYLTEAVSMVLTLL